MKRVNLIPRHRLHAIRMAARRRVWITACAGYALFLLVSIIASSVVRASDDRALQRQIERAGNELESTKLSLSELRAALEDATSILNANRAVGSQPDWGVLLALIAEATESDVVLRVCRLQPDATPRGPLGPGDAPADSADGIAMELGGVGRTQQSVAQFVLRMEQMPLFEQVKLIDTKLEPFLTGEAVAFRLQCQLDPGKEAQP